MPPLSTGNSFNDSGNTEPWLWRLLSGNQDRSTI